MKHRLTIHIGMPKTGTTALQNALFRKSRELSELGLFYPTNIFKCQGKAHHPIAIAVNEANSETHTLACFYQYLTENIDKHILISSEAFNNSLFGEPATRFQKFLDTCRETHSVTMVISIRRLDAFFQSSYLNAFKNGETHDSIEKYLEGRMIWAQRWFIALDGLRENNSINQFSMVTYRSEANDLSQLLDALGLTEHMKNTLGDIPHDNKRLSLKSHIALAHYEKLKSDFILSMGRDRFVKGLDAAELSFEGDTHDYQLLTNETAKSIHYEALELAARSGIEKYVHAFRDDPKLISTSEKPDLSLLTEEDIEKIRLFCT